MSKMLFLAVSMLVAFTLPAQAQPSSQAASRFTKDLLLQDFDSLHLWLKQTHPQLYFHSDPIQTEKRWQKERSKIDSSLTLVAFEQLISPLVAQYQDGHTYVEANLEALQQKGACLFPAPVVIRGNKLYLNDSLGIHPPGTELVSINGIQSADAIRQILPMVPGDHPENIAATASRLFPYYFGICYGFASRFTIRFKNHHTNITANAIDLDTYYKQLFPSPIWSMKCYEAYKLAVITCSNYQGNIETIRQKLDSFFTIIKNNGIEHVALDIRRNGGGNSYIGNVFLSYVTQKPLSGIAAKIYRQSAKLSGMRDSDWPKSQFLEAQQSWKKNGDYYETRLDADALPALSDTSLRFHGSFYLLTSARTYSSAHITAIQVKCSKLGTIIGQPTGEDLNLTGETIVFELPHTKLIVSCPVAMYRPACHSANSLGVQPDLLVSAGEHDVRSGKDSDLEALKALIKKRIE